MRDDKESTIIYQNQVDICKRHMTPEQFGRLMFALFDSNSDPDVDEDIAIAYEFMHLQKQIDSDKYAKRCEQNRINGAKGGAPTGNKNASKTTENNPKQPKTTENNQTDSFGCLNNPTKSFGCKNNPNDNDDDNDNENEDGNENESVPDNDVPLSLLSYLNQKTGSSYSLTDQIRTVIEQRLSEGYTLDQMRSVVDKKFAEWSCDGKMRSYLRPSTLFGDRFEEYLNAPEPAEVEEERKSSEHVASLKKQLREKERDHDGIEKRLADIVQSGRYLSDLHDEYEELKLKSAILEQEIDNLKRRTGAAC